MTVESKLSAHILPKPNMCVSIHPCASLWLSYGSPGSYSAAGLGQTHDRLVLPHCPTDDRAVLLGAGNVGIRGKGIRFRYLSARISAEIAQILGHYGQKAIMSPSWHSDKATDLMQCVSGPMRPLRTKAYAFGDWRTLFAHFKRSKKWQISTTTLWWCISTVVITP